MPDEETVNLSLQKEVDKILEYLSKLSTHYDLYQQRPAELRDVSVQTYYIMIARKVQNQAVGKLKNGFETGDPETFLDGMRKFEEAAMILNLGIDNPEEVNAFYQEMINMFLKFIKDSSDSAGRFEPRGLFFKLRSLVAVAEVLEGVMNDFAKAAGYRSQAAMYEKRWKKALQYIYIIFDLVLSGNHDVADQYISHFDSPELQDEIMQLAAEGNPNSKATLVESIDAFKALGAVIIAATQKQTLDSINIIIDKVNELASRGVPITLVELQKFTQKLATSMGITNVVTFKTDEQVSLEQLKPPMPPDAAGGPAGGRTQPAVQPPVPQAIADQLKDVVGTGMQQMVNQASNGSSMDLNVNSIDAIRVAISDGMKGLANEIVSQLSSKMGSFSGGGGYSGPHGGGGGMRDLDGPGGGPPQIQSLGTAKPTERPPRPKLSDMLNSVIIDE